MKVLYVLDVKQFMYIGQNKRETVCKGVIEDNGVYRPNEMRVGSIVYLMNLLNKLDKEKEEKDIVLCFDSPPVIKRELALKELGIKYKGNRSTPPQHVIYQYDLAKIIFPQMGYNCLIAEGLEADDLIASVVLKYKSVYDSVVIFTEDSDQYYLIDKKTEVQSIRSNGRSVNFYNYRSSVKKNRLVTYNCVNLLKLIEAEKSDNIPALRQDVIDRLVRMIPAEVFPFLGNMALFRTIFKNIVGADDKESLAIFDLINPITVYDERSSITQRGATIDYRMFSYYAVLFGAYGYGKQQLMSNQLGDSTVENFLDNLNRR